MAQRRPVPSRVYDYLAGGLRHDPADAALAEELAAVYPGVRRLVRNNRAYLAHAVLLAQSHLGIRQFLDLGSGFPGPGSVRDAVHAADPEARVACVDLDKAVARYGIRLAMEGVKGFSVATADIRDPAAVLADPRVTEVADIAEPVCVVLGLMANTMEPAQARAVVSGYVRRVAPGSAVVITAAVNTDPALFSLLSKAWAATGEPLVNYSETEARFLFDGLEVLHPGVGPVAWSRPGRLGAVGEMGWKMFAVGGIGVKR